MAEYGARSMATLRAMPWYVIHCLARTPMAASLRPPTQTPVKPSVRSPRRPDTLSRTLQGPCTANCRCCKASRSQQQPVRDAG